MQIIRQGISSEDRLRKLRSVAYYQLKSLENNSITDKLKKNMLI